MLKQTKMWVGVLAIAMMLVGFFVGNFVQADIIGQPEPGSSQDPIVTQSYVDAQVKALRAEVQALQNRVAVLEQRSGTAPTTPPVVTPTTPNTTTPPAYTAKKVYVSGTVRVNVRSGPGISNSIVDKLNPNIAATLLSEKSGWYNIKLSNGKTGWVSDTVTVVK